MGVDGFRFDLAATTLGREIHWNLTPMTRHFSDAVHQDPILSEVPK